MDTMISLELDVAYTDTLEQSLFDLTEGLESITYRVVVPDGPGGGWPIIRFAGESNDMHHMVYDRYCDGDDEQAREFLDA